MSTIQSIVSSETINPTSLAKINQNFTNLNTDKLEASAIAWKQDTLVSWTNIKTINWVTLLWSGNISIPALTDWDKWDLTLSSSGTVWTIDTWVVTNAKLANVASGTFKGRTTIGSGVPEDLTGTQATALLDTATTSLKGLMSPTDKTKLDWLNNEWTQIYSGSFTAWTNVLNTSTLTTYDQYRIDIVATQTGSSLLSMRLNLDSSPVYSRNSHSTSWSGSVSTALTELNLFSFAWWSGYRFVGRYFIDRASSSIVWDAQVPFDSSFHSSYLRNWYYLWWATTSIQINNATNISWTVKISGRNY